MDGNRNCGIFKAASEITLEMKWIYSPFKHGENKELPECDSLNTDSLGERSVLSGSCALGGGSLEGSHLTCLHCVDSGRSRTECRKNQLFPDILQERF